MKLKKCLNCNKSPRYTLRNTCPKCNKKTVDAHYKFIRRSVNKETKQISK